MLSDSFTRPDGLVTNEFAFWNATSPDAIVSPIWEMTSGSMFARSGFGYTGVPDAIAPNATSSNATNSALFRLNTRHLDFGNVAVNFRLSNLGFTQTSTTPPVAWDGVHVFLRYQSEYSLYYTSINRRDGTAVIKKKVPGGPSNDGTYFTLASAAHAVPMSSWQAVRAEVVTNSDGSVTMRLLAGGALIVQATDSGTGGPPISQPGAVGIRGDNTRFQFDDFTVTALGG